MKYQEAKNTDLGIHYKNDPNAKVDFAVGDMIATEKDGVGTVVGRVVAICGQQLTCEWGYGIFYAWSWQARKVDLH